VSIASVRERTRRLDYHDAQIIEIQQVLNNCQKSIAEVHELLIAWRRRPWWKRLLGLR
jgi:hypothetical protein